MAGMTKVQKEKFKAENRKHKVESKKSGQQTPITSNFEL
jgi:hypothetical protein